MVTMTSTASKLVLVVNSGSSSLKFKLFNAAAGLRGEVSGLVERIGDVTNSRIITTNLNDPSADKTTVDRGVKASAHCLVHFYMMRTDKVLSRSCILPCNNLCRITLRRWITCCSIWRIHMVTTW